MKPNTVQKSNHSLNTFMDNFFNRSISDFVGRDTNASPAVNIVEDEAVFRIDLAAPGLDKADFTLKVEKDHLTIGAQKETTTETENTDYKRREFNYQSFQRSFQLSKNIDKEAITANYEDGILAITLPKKEVVVEDQVKTIEIS